MLFDYEGSITIHGKLSEGDLIIWEVLLHGHDIINVVVCFESLT